MTLLDRLAALRALLDRLGAAMNAVAGWLLILCAVLISVDIACRDLVGVSLGATLEISSYLLAVSLSWGLAKAMAERQHVRIDVLIQRAPLRLRPFLHLAALAAMLVWCGFLGYGAVALVDESYDFHATDRSAFAIPMILPQGLWAFGIVAFLVFVAVLLLEIAVAAALGRADYVEDLMGPRTLDEEAKEALEAVTGTPRGTA